MPDNRTDPSAAFALRLSADLLTALVITGALSRRAAAALVDDALDALLQSRPEHEQSLREIAATLTTQAGLVSIEAERDRSGK